MSPLVAAMKCFEEPSFGKFLPLEKKCREKMLSKEAYDTKFLILNDIEYQMRDCLQEMSFLLKYGVYCWVNK